MLQVALLDTIACLVLLALLTLGIPVGLPDGKQLTLGMLQTKNACVEQPIQLGCLEDVGEVEVVAVLRQELRLLLQPIPSAAQRSVVGNHLPSGVDAAAGGTSGSISSRVSQGGSGFHSCPELIADVNVVISA